MKDCIFCQIVNKKLPCHKIWEDENHIAFLSIFPNTEGFSVVATKKHYPANIHEVPEQVALDLFQATKKVGALLTEKLDDVGRTGIIFEGFGVNHLHLKLFPMHGTADLKKWKPITSKKFDRYFEKYQGFISSNDSKRADDKKLAKLAEKIRNK
ncbi:MAG: hypothetical protein MAG795_01239 [Candidatus Woesearchaeota archaeon]|nr:hypothetical protein [Candidatus Woesearchaeota archaeon]